MEIGASEAETFWAGFLRKLARRGLRGVKLVISDSHEGIKAAVSKVMSTTWQRCRVHPRVKPEGMLHAQRSLPCRQAGTAASEFLGFRPDLVGDVAPLLAGGIGIILGEGGGDEGGDEGRSGKAPTSIWA